jgi:chemotaxis response regulator CheB
MTLLFSASICPYNAISILSANAAVFVLHDLYPQASLRVVTPMRLLVVDDSATIRAIVEQIVEGDPDCHIVGVAGDVDTARRLVEQLRPNLITLDLNLPGTPGLEFLNELGERLNQLAVVVLSSSTAAESPAVRLAMARGASACFDKNRVVSHASDFLRLLRKTLANHGRVKGSHAT